MAGEKMELIEKISELENLINKYKNNYWSGEGEQISDFKYDSYIEELKNIHTTNKLLTSIECIKDTNKKIKHEISLLSLDKVYNFDDLIKWCEKVSRDSSELFSITPKYDGISAVNYKNLGIIASRGDGVFGEDLTPKTPLLEFVEIFNKSQQKVYGEIVVKKTEFKKCKLRRKDGSEYKHPRSLVAGVMNPERDDVLEIQDKVQLTFIQHNYLSNILKITEIKEQWEDIINNFKNIVYPIDGIVIKLKDSQYGKSLGETSHHPRNAIAFKFPDEKKESVVIDIEWSCGKRKITPVCIIEPLELDGSNIRRITLHNIENIFEINLRIGDYVTVVRRGGVIPYIESVRPGIQREKIIINECPSCGGNVEYIKPDLICKNVDCDGSLKRKLLYSVKILEIDGLSEATIDKIVDTYPHVRNVIDIFNLTRSNILELYGFGEKSTENLYNEITRIKTNSIEDWKILASLSLNGIGKTLSKQILLEKNFSELLSMSLDDFMSFNNIGPERAEVIYNGIKNNINLINNMISDLNIKQSKGNQNKKQLTICFSGEFPKRKDFYYNIAKERGLLVTESVTKTLSYLVFSGASTIKERKARDFNVRILSEEIFLQNNY